MTKKEVMDLLFTKEEQRKIDVAVPLGSVPKGHEQFYVTDYKDSVLGRVVSMRCLAFTKNVEELMLDYALSPYEATVHIEFDGDRSTGIMPYSYRMTFHRDCISDDENREFLRKEIQQLYAEIES
jgi:hypothetical protein